MEAMNARYTPEELSRQEVDALPGLTVLEFGSNVCGFCHAAQPHIAAALQAYPGLRRIKVEDGPGRPLGRSLRVKLWPTLVVLRQGEELARVVRPGSSAAVQQALAQAHGEVSPS